VAVMIDTRRPLELTAAGRAACDPDYWRSWQTPAR
jgi:homogentisate 1,2-dioxygenase